MEVNQRCRFWPDCEIHAGERRERSGKGGAALGRFSSANYAEMVELIEADGWTYGEVAEAFGSCESSVWEMVFRERRRRSEPA